MGKKVRAGGGRAPIELKMQAGQPTSQCFSCSGCGDCCRGRFAIVVTDQDKQRIEQQGWTDDELRLGGRPLFTRSGDGYQLAHRPTGECVFLQDDNRCAIHARHGEDAKPVACRLYPFRYIPLGSQVRIDVRLDCPTAAANVGRPAAAHRADLLGLLPQAVPDRARDLPVPNLHGAVKATWPLLARITDSFERVLTDVSLDITRRATALAAYASLLRQSPVATLQGAKLDEFLEMAEAHVQEGAAEEPLFRVAPTGPEAMAFRQLAGAYGRLDRVGSKPELLRKLTTGLRMARGKGDVPPLQDGFPTVAFDTLEKPFGVPSGEAAAALERYLHVHMTAMSFFGESFYGRTYLDGMTSLILTYPIVCWLARAHASAAGLAGLDAASVQKAMAMVDHNHGVLPLLDLPTERMRARQLGEPSTLHTLIVWYGT